MPKEVLLRILGLAAAQPGVWMTGTTAASPTEGLPKKPLAMKELVELHHNGVRGNNAAVNASHV